MTESETLLLFQWVIFDSIKNKCGRYFALRYHVLETNEISCESDNLEEVRLHVQTDIIKTNRCRPINLFRIWTPKPGVIDQMPQSGRVNKKRAMLDLLIK